MDTTLAKKILAKMKPKHEGVPGNENYYAFPYGFYEFEEFSKLSRADYESLIVDMKREGLVSIDFKGSVRYEKAIITETQKGFLYFQEGTI